MFGDSDTIVDMYDDLCKDNAPMVRKAAISIIPEFIKVMDVLYFVFQSCSERELQSESSP